MTTTPDDGRCAVNLTDAALDELLSALSVRGFTLPFSAQSRDLTDARSQAARDVEAWKRNRAALRAALEAIR